MSDYGFEPCQGRQPLDRGHYFWSSGSILTEAGGGGGVFRTVKILEMRPVVIHEAASAF